MRRYLPFVIRQLSLICLLLFLVSTSRAQEQKLFDSLHARLAYARSDAEKSDILRALSVALEETDTSATLGYATQSYEYARAARDQARMARFDLFMGKRFSQQGRYDSARPRLMMAMKQAEEAKDTDLWVRTYSQLGWNDMEIGDFREALDFHLRALDLAVHSRDSVAIGLAYNSLGCLAIDQKERSSALNYLGRALAFSRHTGDLRTQAAVYNNIGLNYADSNAGRNSMAGGLDTALSNFRRSGDLYEKLDDRVQRARVLGNIGAVFERKGTLDSALYYYRQSISLHENSDASSTYTAGAYASLGNLFLSVRRNDSAFYYLNLAREIDERAGAKRGLYDRYLSLAKAYAQVGDFKQAYAFLDKGAALHDSLFNGDKSRILADMEGKYQSSKKEAELSTQREELSRQRWITYAIILVAIALSIISILIYRSDRQKQRANEELARAKDRAEASELLEKQFLANMSHEIRTPMNAVLGMTRLLLETDLVQKQRDYLEAIAASADNLLVIINDILDLSKLQAGKMEFERVPFRLRDVTGHVLEMMRFKAEAKGLKLVAEIDESAPEVVIGDSTRLNQILVNLMGNAIKFTDHGTVTLTASASAVGLDNRMTVRFAVRDTGIGISKEKQHAIFDSFSQADSETTRKYGGTGLGLTISRTLVELQGGTIGVTSELGHGSEFAFTTPYDVTSEEALNGEARATRAAEVIDPALLRGIHILLVEDNEYNQIVLADTLRNVIGEVALEIANNGREAIALVERFGFDLVLMDVQMPEMDGIEATKHIRARLPRSKKDVPIIALTASVIKSEIDRCFAAGMNDYVPKPFKRDELLRVLVKYFKRSSVPSPAAAAPIANGHADEAREAVTLSGGAQPTPMRNGMNDMQPAAGPALTDLSTLRDITGGDENQLKKYIKMFLDGVPPQLESIRVALEANDFAATKRQIHAMKPHLKFMGMKHTAGFAESIEQLCADAKDPDRVKREFVAVQTDCARAFEELRAKL
ncbi:MAG: ATP-binding protein [Bacteroidota bacterium]|nr:ATP-binding protein [Bacteroidota bacterium]MDP4231816.1 ATP-binding protein [Bacteroidota bacterium]MDP4242702.1 ATP-binding protein [Bacteroidota bacterium]MDP4287153.1 ATP-binding protein [Bacteroidota bacterium]